MQKVIIISIFLFSFLTTVFAQDDIEKEKELVKEVIQNAYVDGLCNNADVEAINKGFHPGFELLGVDKGNIMWKYPIYSWMENAIDGKKSGKKYSFQNELTTIKFLFVDIAGNAAVAKIEFYEGGEFNFIDYLSLLKFEDGWKIVTKIYYAVPKEKK